MHLELTVSSIVAGKSPFFKKDRIHDHLFYAVKIIVKLLTCANVKMKNLNLVTK